MGDKLRFDDESHGGLYEPTDSEDEYSEEEKELLQKVRQRNRREQNSKQEVLAFDDSDEDDDDDDDDEDNGNDFADHMSASDIEGASDDDEHDLPDRKAWGSKARNFYGTDFVDPDYSTFTDKDRELALAEEEEALAIQRRMASYIKEENFKMAFAGLETGDMSEEEDEIMPGMKVYNEPKTAKAQEPEVIKFETDLSGVSRAEKIAVLKKESPEFIGLAEDLLLGLKECGSLLAPVLSYAKANKLPHIPALEFAQIMYTLLTTYCSNINFYLMLKAKLIPIKTHPVINRLLQLKEMLDELNDRYENTIKPQLEALLERINDGDVIEIIVDKQTSTVKKATTGKKAKKSALEDIKEWQKMQVCSGSSDDEESKDDAEDKDDEDAAEDLSEEEGTAEHGADEGDGDERRGITYQMAKNKGLTPHRKKELRNPRVKHRNKFRKALIRRKGAVRTVRKETKRYGGEISGIKTTVSKSRKFK